MSTIDILKKAPIFENLDDDQLKKVSSRGEEKMIEEGEFLFKEGDTGNDAFVILDGRVQITVEMDMPTEQAPVHTVTEGGILGEFALVSDHERSASARAVKDTKMFVLSRDAFLAIGEEDPHMGYRMLFDLSQILVGRLIKTTRELRSSLMF